MAKLSNTQIKTLVNTAYNQFTGQTATTDELDLTAFTDNGENAIGENDREKFTGALLGVIAKTWYTDTSYRSEYNDIYYEDSEQFGAITQMIHAEAPDVIDNAAWGDFISGTSKADSTQSTFRSLITNCTQRRFHGHCLLQSLVNSGIRLSITRQSLQVLFHTFS